MASAARREALSPMPLIVNGLPIMYEDDKEPDLGESNPHVLTDHVLFVCLSAHFARSRKHQVFSNMNLYYGAFEDDQIEPPYVSPDAMVVRPYRRLPKTIRSYRIGVNGPAPIQTAEILSERSYEQRDLNEKALLYARLRVAEYILVDTTGRFLRRKLLLKRLLDGRWRDEQDAEGGVTSSLGFRLIIDSDGELTVLNRRTGRSYVRPLEAERRVRQLEAELARLRRSRKKKT